MGTGRNQSQQTIDFVNRSGETIPPHGLVRIEDTEVVNDQRIATGKKPDGTAPACAHLVNSYLEVLDTRQGNGGIPSAPIWIAYDSGSGTPAVGDEWGPVSSGWKLDASGSGFHIRSVAVGDVVLAVECGGGGGGGGDTSSCDCLSDFNGVQTTTHCSGAVDAWEWDASVVMDELGCTLTTSGDKTAVNWDPATPDIYNSRDFVDCGYDSAKWELDLSVGLMPGQVELRLVHDDPDVDVRYRNAYYWRCDGRNWMVPTVNKLPATDSPTLCAVCLEPVVCNTVCKDGINLRDVDEWEVTIAGVTGGTCQTECEGINGTWRLKFGSEPVECKSWVWGTTGSDPGMSLTIATDANGDTVYALRITTYLANGPCDTSNHGYELSVSQPAEQCIQSRELADTGNASGESCSNWPATLTITPIT